MSLAKISFSLPADLLEKIEARASALGLSRSAYIVQIIRADVFGDQSGLKIVAEQKTDKPYGDGGKNRLPPEKKGLK